jgi:hypothetical protein
VARGVRFRRVGLRRACIQLLAHSDRYSTFVIEYAVDESLDEMIAFVRLLVMNQAAFDAGRAKQKIPKPKVEVEEDGKQVVKILKNAFATQRSNMGVDAKVSPNWSCATTLTLVSQTILSNLDKHKEHPLPLNQYHAHVIKAAIYRLLYVAEKELDDRLKVAVKAVQEKSKASKKRGHGDGKDGSNKKPKNKGR